jgi:hypothetical protein
MEVSSISSNVLNDIYQHCFNAKEREKGWGRRMMMG